MEKRRKKLWHANISNTPLDQKFPGHPVVGALWLHTQTDRQPEGHGNSMTDLAQRAKSVKKSKKISN